MFFLHVILKKKFAFIYAGRDQSNRKKKIRRSQLAESISRSGYNEAVGSSSYYKTLSSNNKIFSISFLYKYVQSEHTDVFL